MASSRNLSTLFNAVFPFADFFYILQQEEYSSARFLKWLPHFFFRRNFQKRDTLKYTKRVISSLTFVVIVWLVSFFIVAAIVSRDLVTDVTLAIIWILTIPLFVFVGNYILTPYYNYRKIAVMDKAALAVRRQKGMNIVGVAGSFGKTTTKNFIYQLARYNYATQMVPGNINTPLGIAMWVNAYLKPGTQLLIVEMDAYQKGEIAQSCSVAPADIAIITNIGDQHMERFGTSTHLAEALSEIFDKAKPGSPLLCTPETTTMIKQLIHGDRVITPISIDILSVVGEETRKQFSRSNEINLAFAIKTAQLLGVPKDYIIDTAQKMELPDRRQKESEWNGYSAIDDSYNISLTTAKAGIEAAAALATAENKKLFIIAAGIPELGPREKNGNKTMGTLMARQADHIVVLDSVFAQDIINGIADSQKYTIVSDLASFIPSAHEQFPPSEWVVLVQPELTDLYY